MRHSQLILILTAINLLQRLPLASKFSLTASPTPISGAMQMTIIHPIFRSHFLINGFSGQYGTSQLVPNSGSLCHPAELSSGVGTLRCMARQEQTRKMERQDQMIS
jgi:hypothetical protein